VTAPVSSLIMPNTYGEPVALCGVPNTELAAAAVALPVLPVLPAAGLLDAAAVGPAGLAGLLELPELLELQPTAASARTAMAAAPTGLRCFMLISSLAGVSFSRFSRSGLSLGQAVVLGQAAVSPR
jgi:hypothetical protein